MFSCVSRLFFFLFLFFLDTASQIQLFYLRHSVSAMAILLEIKKEMDKQRGPLVRAFLFDKAINDENLSAADLFLKHMRKETKADKRAILTTIELPDPD